MGIIERVSGASASLRFTSVSGFHRNELTWSLLALQFVCAELRIRVELTRIRIQTFKSMIRILKKLSDQILTKTSGFGSDKNQLDPNLTKIAGSGCDQNIRIRI